MKIYKTSKYLRFWTHLILAGLIALWTITITYQEYDKQQYKVCALIEQGSTLNNLKIQDRQLAHRQYMDSLEYIDTEEYPQVIEKDLKIEKIESFIKNKFPTSPLIDNIDTFFSKGKEKGFTDEQITLLIAISGTESGFGTKAKYHNYWGIMCNRGQGYTTDCGWNDDEYAISRAFDLVGSYLKRWNGNNTDQVFIGKGKYCTSGCTSWVGSTEYFYSNLVGE